MVRRITWYFIVCLSLVVASQSRQVALAQADAQGDASILATDSGQEIEEPAEESPLLSDPTTPEAAFEAVVLMVDLAQPRLARSYLEKLMKMNPDDAAILKIRDKYGPAIFLRLSNIKSLQPLSIRLLNRMNVAFRKGATDPARVDRLIADLTQSPAKRDVAIIQMRSAGPVIIPRLLSQLSDPNKTGQRDLLVYTLTRLGKQNIPALLGALQVRNADLKANIIEALGWIGTSQVTGYLWYPAFAPGQPAGVRDAARRALSRIMYGTDRKVGEVSNFGTTAEISNIARQHFRNEYPWELDDDGNVIYWSVDPETGTLASKSISPEEASLIVGNRFGREALDLASQNIDIQALYLGLAFAFDRYKTGWDRPLKTGPGTIHNLALTAGADIVTEVLVQSLDNANPASALAALQVLGQIATRHQLYGNSSQNSPILSALNYPDERVQFTAATTILELAPEDPFRGAQRVVQILQRALMDAGKPHCVVVDSSTSRANVVTGIFSDLGYLVTIAATGQQGFRIAADRGDIELIVLRSNTIRWGLSQTAANLRADARTARIPIVIMGPETSRKGVEGLMRRHYLVTFIVETTSTNNVNPHLKAFLSMLETPELTQQQRAKRMQAAAFWFAHIANGRRLNVFNIAPAEKALLGAINNPDLAENAIFALSAIASRTAQQGLKDTAISDSMSASVRVSAAVHLAFHIQRFGLSLESQHIREIESARQTATDAALKTSLASVIGSLKPDAKRVSQLLQNFVWPAAANP